jgi:hypothetical protein
MKIMGLVGVGIYLITSPAFFDHTGVQETPVVIALILSVLIVREIRGKTRK